MTALAALLQGSRLDVSAHAAELATILVQQVRPCVKALALDPGTPEAPRRRRRRASSTPFELRACMPGARRPCFLHLWLRVCVRHVRELGSARAPRACVRRCASRRRSGSCPCPRCSRYERKPSCKAQHAARRVPSTGALTASPSHSGGPLAGGGARAGRRRALGAGGAAQGAPRRERRGQDQGAARACHTLPKPPIRAGGGSRRTMAGVT